MAKGKVIQRIRTRKDGSTYIEPLYSLQYYNPIRKRTVIEPTGLPATPAGYKKAEVLLRQREGAKDRGEVIYTTVGKTTMDKLFDMVETDYVNNDFRSLDDLERRLKLYLRDFFGGKKAAAVTYEDIENYKKMRKETRTGNGKKIKGASKATINRELSIVRKAFRLGVKAKLVQSVPVFDMLDERDNVREGFIEVSDFLRILSFLPVHLQDFSGYCYLTACRRGEALGTLWDYVNRVDCVITLPAKSSKNKRQRTLEYGKNQELRDLIERQWKRKGEIEAKSERVKIIHVFFHDDGRPIKDFRRSWKMACEAAGLKGKLFHD
jgi:integrase